MSLRLGKSNNPFESREIRPAKQMKKKIFFVFEGEETERIYFEKIKLIIDSSSESHIPELYIFDRILKNKSNQLYVTENIKECLDHGKNLRENNGFEDLYALVSQFEEDTDFSYDDLIKSLESFFEGRPKIIEAISKTEKVVEVVEQIDALSNISTYKKGFDNICIILDRDKKSFTERQLESVIEICKENNFFLGLTNPCFEFYLLLHLSDGSDYSVKDLLENKKITTKKTYAHVALMQEYIKITTDKIYKKSKYDPGLFLSRIDDLYENSKEFPINIDNLNSNVGSLIPEMLEELGIKDIISDYYK